ncbi:hypothetical protein IMF27_04300 [Pseudomonas sp. PCH199]|uniref:hypothetical protein n=1 Tax=unclassified Pseudomonas TaxID=196821 RepID=UPI000FFC35F3|nr:MULTISPECIES: hypothetical protein [unclassified Pseudomonas]MCW8275018.1 hypothetical protein [Pseudomonas sp. PCH199]
MVNPAKVKPLSFIREAKAANKAEFAAMSATRVSSGANAVQTTAGEVSKATGRGLKQSDDLVGSLIPVSNGSSKTGPKPQPATPAFAHSNSPTTAWAEQSKKFPSRYSEEQVRFNDLGSDSDSSSLAAGADVFTFKKSPSPASSSRSKPTSQQLTPAQKAKARDEKIAAIRSADRRSGNSRR